jgi:hypothetical protein
MKTIISKIFLIDFCTGIGSPAFSQGDEDKAVTEKLKQKYSYVYFSDGYYKVELKGKVGAADGRGNEIVSCEYTYIDIGKEAIRLAKGGAKGGNVADYDSRNFPPIGAKWGMYANNRLIACKYDYLSLPSEGLVAFNVGGNLTDVRQGKISGGKWGYIDLNGKEIIPALYETADNFKDGAAMVSLNGQTALIENPLSGGKANIGVTGGFAAETDVNIPATGAQNDETFAFIFANDSYLNFSVPFANNDGKIFREYCQKTLGVPEKNIRFYENATIGNMASAVNRIKEIADTYDGDARFIVYYSGQGLTDESSKTPYLLPVDAVLTNLAATGYSVEKLNKELSQLPAKSTLLVLDACFNGCDREGKMLTAARSIAVKAKPNYASGSLIVFSATTSDETAYQYKDKNHGLLTYFLLKKLQETKGDITYRLLTDYVISEVKKQSLSNSKIQSPSVTVSDKLTNWQTLKLK